MLRGAKTMVGMHEIVGCDDLKKELKRSFKRMINTDWAKSKRIPPKGVISLLSYTIIIIALDKRKEIAI